MKPGTRVKIVKYNPMIDGGLGTILEDPKPCPFLLAVALDATEHNILDDVVPGQMCCLFPLNNLEVLCPSTMPSPN